MNPKTSDLTDLLIAPDDEYNRMLVGNVRPLDWANPEPAERYNIVVLGAGTAGLVTAAIAAGLGAKVALVEKHLMGGDCLNVGCVPSKGLIRASRAWADLRRAEDFGLGIPDGVTADFAAAMARMRRLRARISRTDSAHRYRNMGVDVFIGEGRFTGPDRIAVQGKELRFARAAICTGARAAALPIPGLREAGALTNETVFNLTELPSRLAVIGAGPIGCELAQAFSRFGSRVTVFEQECRILPREDLDAARVVEQAMRRDGVSFVCDAKVERVENRGGEKIVRFATGVRSEALAVDQLLIGIGRAPNVAGLGLDRVGVEYGETGVKVDEHLHTTNRSIYAAGDVCFPFNFTHTADAMAQILIQNALFPHPFGLGYASTASMIIPWCTYTEPEVAHVGLYPWDAEKQGIEVETYTVGLEDVDRAILDGEEEGFARIHLRKGSDKLLGATVVAAHAGDLINEFSVLMQAGGGVKTIAHTIHPYPTQGEVNKKTVNAWRKAHFTERTKTWLRRWFTWSRG